MKHLTVIAAGLGFGLLERHGLLQMAGLSFEPAPSVFPAVTCVAQATLRTGLAPAEHGMVANGVWMDDLRKPLFWEQSSRLVKGRRIWADRRAAGGTGRRPRGSPGPAGVVVRLPLVDRPARGAGLRVARGHPQQAGLRPDGTVLFR